MFQGDRVVTKAFGVVLVSALVLAACQDASGPGENGSLSREEAVMVASLVSDMGVAAVGLAVADPASGSRTFNRTLPCPGGGSMTFTASHDFSVNEATKVLTTQWTATHTHAACTSERERAGKTFTVVVDGSVTNAGTASYQLPANRGEPRVLLSWSATRTGSTTTTVGDRSRTCEINVTESFDPATKTFTLTGTVCGREVSRTRTLP